VLHPNGILSILYSYSQLSGAGKGREEEKSWGAQARGRKSSPSPPKKKGGDPLNILARSGCQSQERGNERRGEKEEKKGKGEVWQEDSESCLDWTCRIWKGKYAKRGGKERGGGASAFVFLVLGKGSLEKKQENTGKEKGRKKGDQEHHF